MMFSSSGSTGVPRIFRYSQIDRELWAWANARALHAMDPPGRHGVHVHRLRSARVGLGRAVRPREDGRAVHPGRRHGRRMRARARRSLQADHPALHAVLRAAPRPRHGGARAWIRRGPPCARCSSPASPAAGIEATRERIEALWDARIVEFYGCTEARRMRRLFLRRLGRRAGPVSAHLMEDVQFWEVVDPETRRRVDEGGRGLTVCTNLNSESSPQLRFLVGDYTVFTTRAVRVRPHPRARDRLVRGPRRRSDQPARHQDVPVHIEDAVRAVPGIGDEFEIVLATTADGLDVMTVRCEHADASIGEPVASEIRARCEVRVDVEVLAPGHAAQDRVQGAARARHAPVSRRGRRAYRLVPAMPSIRAHSASVTGITDSRAIRTSGKSLKAASRLDLGERDRSGEPLDRGDVHRDVLPGRVFRIRIGVGQRLHDPDHRFLVPACGSRRCGRPS